MDLPDFRLGDLPALGDDIRGGGLDPFDIENELKLLRHLEADRRFEEPHALNHSFRTEATDTAAQSLGRIPNADDCFHLLITGRFSLWEYVPACLLLAGETSTIDTLHVATLGFSMRNIQSLSALIDAGRIRAATLLCSHYFKGTSRKEYEFAEAELGKRNQRFGSCRTHAKLLMMQFADGRAVTIESSANLRSCKNLEQVTAFGSPEVCRFHVSWIEAVLE